MCEWSVSLHTIRGPSSAEQLRGPKLSHSRESHLCGFVYMCLSPALTVPCPPSYPWVSRPHLFFSERLLLSAGLYFRPEDRLVLCDLVVPSVCHRSVATRHVFCVALVRVGRLKEHNYHVEELTSHRMSKLLLLPFGKKF